MAPPDSEGDQRPRPVVRPTLAYDHLSEHCYGLATLLYANDPAGAKTWLEQNRGKVSQTALGRC